MGNFLFKKEVGKSLVTVIAVMSVIVLLRLLFDQWQEYNFAMKSLEVNNKKGAVMYFDRVLNAHVPFSPIEDRAKAQLIRLASDFEKENEQELSLLCYETVRTSRYLTRHFWIPNKGDIPFLNDKIASIKARLLVKDGIVKDFRTGYDQQMGIMNKDFSPSVVWSVIAITAFFAYIGSVILWIFSRKKIYIAVFCLCFIVWSVALYIA